MVWLKNGHYSSSITGNSNDMECCVTLEESSIVVGYVKVYPSITTSQSISLQLRCSAV